MPTFPAKTNYASGDILTAAQMVDVGNGLNDLLPDAKGSLTTVSAANTPAQLTVGANGETLVADSSASTGLRWQTAANSNSIVNGGMDFWQRGTSFSAPASNSYIADRWQYQRSTVTGSALSRQSSGLDGIQYALRFGRDSGSTNVTSFFLGHNLETSESIRFQNKTVVISFYARKGANYSGQNLTVYMATGTGTDQNILTSGFTSQTAVINTTTAFTTSWERYSFTASIGASATQIGFYFGWTPSGTAGANDWVEITGVQLEVGSVATTFKRAGGTLAGELQAAQRYYWRVTDTANSYAPYGTGFALSATSAQAWIQHPVIMRANPSSVDAQNIGFLLPGTAGYTTTSITIQDGRVNGATIVLNGITGLTANRPYFVTGQNLASYLGFSAEL